mmetsp:Transcript_21655/g.33896  ORF Transcript_21655/g.33896 Transcript_21655/m.33896 type:complete len:251 (-) Transcript_21655:341-1093(-)
MSAMRGAAVAGVLAACAAVVAGEGATTSPGLWADSKTPGMLISSSRWNRGGNTLGFVGGAEGAALLRRNTPRAAIRQRPMRLRAGSKPLVTMGASGQHLVTFGDVWNDICESENMEWDCPTGGEETLHGVVLGAVSGAASTVGNCAVRKLGAVWDFITHSPNPDEVQKNLQAFAKCHSGAVMPPLSEDQIGDQVKYYGIIPEMCSAMVDADIDKALEDAETLEHEFTEKVRDMSKSKLRDLWKASQAAQA